MRGAIRRSSRAATLALLAASAPALARTPPAPSPDPRAVLAAARAPGNPTPARTLARFRLVGLAARANRWIPALRAGRGALRDAAALTGRGELPPALREAGRRAALPLARAAAAAARPREGARLLRALLSLSPEDAPLARAEVLEAWARLAAHFGDAVTARDRIARARALRARAPAPGSPSPAPPALEDLEGALDRAFGENPPGHPEVVLAMQALARACRKAPGEEERATSLFLEVLQTLEPLRGKLHPEVLAARTEWVESLPLGEAPDDPARRVLLRETRTLVALRRAVAGPDAPVLVEDLRRQGRAEVLAGLDPRAAARTFEAAVEIAEHHVESDPALLLLALKDLADHRERSGQDGEARTLRDLARELLGSSDGIAPEVARAVQS